MGATARRFAAATAAALTLGILVGCGNIITPASSTSSSATAATSAPASSSAASTSTAGSSSAAASTSTAGSSAAAGSSTTGAITHPSYQTDLLPIFNANCAPCHTGPASSDFVNFQVNTYAGIMKGGALGPAINTKNPSQSLIILLLEGQDPALPGIRMPFERPALPQADIQTILHWIKDGAPNN